VSVNRTLKQDGLSHYMFRMSLSFTGLILGYSHVVLEIIQ